MVEQAHYMGTDEKPPRAVNLERVDHPAFPRQFHVQRARPHFRHPKLRHQRLQSRFLRQSSGSDRIVVSHFSEGRAKGKDVALPNAQIEVPGVGL